MAVIKGRWRWRSSEILCFTPNDSRLLPSYSKQYHISFTSGGNTYSCFLIQLASSGNTRIHKFAYLNENNGRLGVNSQHTFSSSSLPGTNHSGLWGIADSYREINFGPTNQTIDDEFYSFFVQRAEQILGTEDYLNIIAENQSKVYNAGYQKGYQEGLDSFVDTFCNPDSFIPVLYAEYVDVQSTSTNNSESTNKHLIGPVYGLNNENERVPILYHIDYTDMGVDKYYYVGQDTKEGTLYDKWRKIEPGKSFGWDSLQKIYVYTAPVITSEEL